MKKLILNINAFKSGIVFTAILLFTVFNAVGQTTYTSIGNGDWDDDIWSTDGVNNCACSPDYEVSGNDTIIIKHNVVKEDDNYTVESGGTFAFNPARFKRAFVFGSFPLNCL